MIEGDAPPQPDELDELFSAAPKPQEEYGGIRGFQPTPEIKDLNPPTISPLAEVFGFPKPLDVVAKPPVDSTPERVPSMWTEVPKQLFTMSPQAKLDTEEQIDAKTDNTPIDASKKGEWVNKTYNDMVEALGDWTGNPQKIARLNALKAWRDDEMKGLGFQSVDPFAAPKIERITPQQAGVLFGVDQEGRTAKNIANAQGVVAGAAESFITPEGATMVGPKAIAKPIATAFVAMMSKDALEQTGVAIKKYAEGDTEGGDAALVAAGATAAMLGLPALAGKGPDKARELAKLIEKGEFKPRITPEEAALLRNRLPPRAATPEMLPELQRTKELVDQAIQEATQKIVEPGKVSALELLRRQNEKLTEAQPVTLKPDTGFERPAEEVMRGRTVAEKPLTPEVSNAVVKEAEPVLRSLQQEPVESKTEVPQEVSRPKTDAGGGEAVKVGELPATEAAYNQPTKPEVAKLGEGERKNGYGDPATTTYHATPEDWSVWESVKDKPLTEPGVWATREAIKNKYGGMPPEAPKAAGEIVIETPKDIISKLQSLKVDPKKDLPPGQSFSLPHPDAIKIIGKQLWNDALDVAIAAVKAGRTIKAGVAEAIAHIKRNARNYDETQIRKNIESVLKDEGLVQPPRKEKPATAEVPAKTGSGIEVPEGKKERSFSARATVSEKVPEPVQEAIKTDERSVYTPQDVAETVTEVKGLDSSSLAAMDVTDNRFTAGKLELAERLSKAGDGDAVLNVVQDASEQLTRAGQIINQAKLLNALKPETQVLVINDGLKKAGKDPLTPAQQQKALDLAREAKDAKAKLDAATEAWKEKPTDENAKIAEDAFTNANRAALDFQKMANTFQPKTWGRLLKTVLQGNLLTPMSLTANVASLAGFIPIRAAMRTGKTAVDIFENFLVNKKRTSAVSPIRGTAESLKGMGRGLANAREIALHGSGSAVVGEQKASLKPIKAWIDQFSKNPEMPTEGGKITLGDRAKLFIEGTFGIPAEAMLRGLGAGDAVVKEGIRSRIITNEAKLAGIKPENLNMAIKFPELFFDDVALERIASNTAAELFQRPSSTLNKINGMIRNNLLTDKLKIAPDTMDFWASTVAPYRVTPWNIIGEVMSYNPAIALGRGLLEGAHLQKVRADKSLTPEKKAVEVRKAQDSLNQSMAKFVLGATMATAGAYLYKYGIITPSLDTKDETMKERMLMGKVMPPNHINMSALNRVMSKVSKGEKPTPEDYQFRSGDDTRDFFRIGGLVGSQFYMAANIGRAMEKNPEVAGEYEMAKNVLTQSAFEQARFGLNQSFLQGVENLMTSVKDGNTDNYVKQWLNTVSSMGLPNTLSTISRATREYKPDFSSKDVSQKFENIIRDRLGFAGADDYMRLKLGLWGEPIRETPQGRNQILYQFFGLTKGQQISSDPKDIELFRLWRKTDNTKVIPTPVSTSLTVRGKNYILTPDQQHELAKLVGEKRAKIVDRLVTNPNWHTKSDEAKIDMLEGVYSDGLDIGKYQFLKNHKNDLTEKPKKAGFEMQ